MMDNICLLGFSGSGKTSYILSLYNYYNKLLCDKTYFVTIKNKETRIYVDKLLRDMKIRKKINSTKENREIIFTLNTKSNYKPFLNFNMPDYTGEMLWKDNDKLKDYLQKSSILVFLIDSTMTLNNNFEFNSQLARIVEILIGLSISLPVLFLLSKYDLILKENPELNFEYFQTEYLSNFKQPEKCKIKEYTLMNLSSYSDDSDEILFEKTINLTDSFLWITQKTKKLNDEKKHTELNKKVKENVFEI